MRYRLAYEPGAWQLARRLAPDLKPLVKHAIEGLRDDPYAGKELKLDLAGYRSLRSRRYRIVYRIREPERLIEVHYFGHRTDVYETMRNLLRSRRR